MIEVGDLVQTTGGARKSLDHAQLGYGCVTKVFSGQKPGNMIVYVCWYAHGHTKPYNTVWLEKVG